MSHYIPHFYELESNRRKRHLVEETVHYVIPLDGVDHHVELRPRREFISPALVVEHHTENIRGNISNVKLKKLRSRQCHYSGFVRGMNTSRAALSTCNGLVSSFVNIILAY
jgi:hypothetical protein